jgi:hypothetical protein
MRGPKSQKSFLTPHRYSVRHKSLTETKVVLTTSTLVRCCSRGEWSRRYLWMQLCNKQLSGAYALREQPVDLPRSTIVDESVCLLLESLSDVKVKKVSC